MSNAFLSAMFGAGVGVALAGCATGNGELPLVFGSTNVYGVSIGGSVADTGGEFVVGYKGLDVAVIPVSAVEAGTETFLGARAGRHRDSYSVIGQFGARAGKTAAGANAGLGKFFATGMAAQNIATGFAKKMGAYGRTSVKDCTAETPAAPAAASATAAAAGPAAPAEPASPIQRWPGGKSSAPGGGARLIFAQYAYKALAIDGSALDSGVRLTFGVRDRNIAFIPTIGRDDDGNLVWLEAGNSSGGRDVLSVLGQFESDDSIGTAEGATTVKTSDGAAAARGISSGLEKFFSTGGAAQILSAGFRVKLCEEYAASSAPQAPALQPAKVVATEAMR